MSPYAPNVINVINEICTVYGQLLHLAPYVASAIIAMVLFFSILFRFVNVVMVFFSVFIAMLIAVFPQALGMLGVAVMCS